MDTLTFVNGSAPGPVWEDLRKSIDLRQKANTATDLAFCRTGVNAMLASSWSLKERASVTCPGLVLIGFLIIAGALHLRGASLLALFAELHGE